VLAAGRGTRMQRGGTGKEGLTPEQARTAQSGLKALMPVGRPFLDFVLSALADAGVTDVCVVIASGVSPIRDRYERETRPIRLRVSFAEQSAARGTANALLTARRFAGDDAFLVLNADNYYPVEALRAMCECGAPCAAAFDRDALVRLGNMPEERVREYAVLAEDADGFLSDIAEKPSSLGARRSPLLVSMNLWSFTTDIFPACEAVTPSARGELELPEAVCLSIREHRSRIHAVHLACGVLDLSRPEDVAVVSQRLRAVRVSL